jgi:DNA-binding PadR family transcriptional regulator
LGIAPADMTPGQVTYHLRRLRLHGLIERIPRTHRYQVTSEGARTALFCTRIYSRLLRPGLAQIIPKEALDDSEWRRVFDHFDEKIDDWIQRKKVPA